MVQEVKRSGVGSANCMNLKSKTTTQQMCSRVSGQCPVQTKNERVIKGWAGLVIGMR